MIDNGGSAFPVYSGSERFASPGMTLRDYFAAKAMPHFLAEGPDSAPTTGGRFFRNDDEWRLAVAVDAYRMADAMLKAREAK